MKEKDTFKIYSFYYEPNELFSAENHYVPIWAGQAEKNNKTGFTGDNSGDNISAKNKHYSELTGLYWVWKNTDTEIVGSCHYRRYFTPVKEPFFYRLKRFAYYFIGQNKKRHGLIYTGNTKFWKDKLIGHIEVEELLNKYDAILPVRRKLKYSIKDHYKRYHNSDDLEAVLKLLSKKHPDYIPTFNKVVNGNRLFANNMFILKKEAFHKLMEWLFKILFELEKELDLTNYKEYQERIFGFLSERLITIWIIHNKIRYKELPLVYFKKFKN